MHVRSGWAESGGGFNHLTSGVMTSVLQLGLQVRAYMYGDIMHDMIETK